MEPLSSSSVAGRQAEEKRVGVDLGVAVGVALEGLPFESSALASALAASANGPKSEAGGEEEG